MVASFSNFKKFKPFISELMRNSNIRAIGYNLFILGFLFLVTACKDSPSKEETNKIEPEEIAKVDEIHWNVKAIYPDGKSLDIKSFDKEGKSYDIMAIQDSDQDVLLDVKAIGADGEKLPVKIVMSNEQFAPVSVISNEGNEYDLKAITEEGERLDVRGIRRFGNIVIIKAITKEGKYIGVKSISPDGRQNDVKGVKVNIAEREMRLKGVGVHAHVKAMHPAANEDKFRMFKKSKKNRKIAYTTDFERILWNIKAVTADGKNLDVKAFDAEGNTFDVTAIQDSEQHSFLNIRAFVDGYELPVKIMESSDEYAPVSAIAEGGTIYEIKAITDDNVKLDIKGISRSGNIIHVKAVDENGEFYSVKAVAPDGKLNEVKGIKIFDRRVEMKVQGQPVYAHLKAINE